MNTELLPVKKTEKGTFIYEGDEYYPASLLANMNISGFPKSRAGIYKFAERHRWQSINVPGKGAKDGVLCYLVPPSLIEGTFEQQYTDAPAGFDDTESVKSVKAKQSNEPYLDDDSVYVERYPDIYGSAGPGSIVDGEWLIERVEFKAAALRQLINVPAKHLKIAGVDGYSMEPYLFHGDQVFIDTRCNTFKNDGVYAIVHDGELRFKRVRVNYADRTVLLKSDNDGGMGPEVLNEKQARDLHIVGKVIPFKFGHFKL